MTFEHDLTARADIDEHIVRLATEVTESVVAEGRTVTHVAVKVRRPSFFTRTKIHKLPAPTIDAGVVASTALELFDGFESDRAVRLLGVRVVLEMPTG